MPRPRKSPEQHKIDGTYRPSLHGPLPDKFQTWMDGGGDGPPPAPVKPDSLSAEASVMWDFVLETRPGMVWPSDGPILAVYCEWWALWKLVLTLAQGKPSAKTLTPLGIITDKVDKLGAKFGLSPKDRVALPVVQTGPKKAKVQSRAADIDAHLPPPPKAKRSK